MGSGNFMIDGDNGSDCRSPYHDSSKCRYCIEAEEETNRERCEKCDKYIEDCECCHDCKEPPDKCKCYDVMEETEQPKKKRKRTITKGIFICSSNGTRLPNTDK